MLKHVGFETVGEGQHRSGWPYCFNALQSLLSEDSPVIFDDFIERTFLYSRPDQLTFPSGKPWVGVLHHPPDIPAWYLPHMQLSSLVENKRWLAVVDRLQLIITLGTNLQQWCQKTWPTIPSVVIKHATGRASVDWSPERFLANRHKLAVQVGWFMRNTTAIYQARVPDWLTKAHLRLTNLWADYAFDACRQTYAKLCPERRDIGQVKELADLNNLQYDRLLSENVVLIEVISAVANNAVVECIQRNTPICLNRHPGPVEYLGSAYPLFYDHFDEIESVLTLDNIMAAHQHLCSMDKWWISGSMFCTQVHAACMRHVPACRAAAVPLDDVLYGS